MQEILAYNSLFRGIIDDKNLEIEPVFKFKLLGYIRKFAPEIADFEEFKNDCIRRFGKEEDGKIFIDPDDAEAIEKMNASLSPVLKQKSDVLFKKFQIKELFDCGLPAEYLLHFYDLTEGVE